MPLRPLWRPARKTGGIQKASRPDRREIELDFIRGIAILAVVDFHSPEGWLFTPFRLLGFPDHFGWTGVSLFFVLSGFLVGGLLVRELKVTGDFAARRFLIRRGLKIWPAYYVFLGLMLITGHRTFHELRGNLLNIQNYTGGVAFTWSLAVEEHAYLFLAALFAFAAWKRVRMRELFFLLATLAILVDCGRLYLLETGHNTFTWTHTRIEGIFYGVMLAILFNYRPDLFRRLQRQRVLWISCILSCLLLLRFPPPGYWKYSIGIDAADLMCVGLFLLLYRRHTTERTYPWFYRAVAWVGLYSYGIYLWHVSMIAPVLAIGARMPSWLAFLWDGLAPVTLAITAGVILTKLIEIPTLRLRDRLFPRKVSLLGTSPRETDVSAVQAPAEQPEPA